MTDREMLEFAAKAAGITVSFDRTRRDWAWNSLDDDGDAFRLAVKLKLVVDCAGDEGVEVIEWEISRTHAFEPFGSDPEAATRLAITRAAAEIGRGME